MGKFFASPVKLPKTELPQYCVHPTIYGHGGHVSHVTLFICINFHFRASISFHMKFGSK